MVIETGDSMTNQARILAAIAARGWFTTDCFWNDACALRDAGVIKMGERFFTGGNRKVVWVAA